MHTIKIQTQSGRIAIDTNTITHITSSSNYCHLYFKDNKRVVLAKLLSWFEHNLDGSQFVRINRSCVINKELIDSVKEENHTAIVQLHNHESFAISRRKLSNCKRVLSGYF